jgi:DUF971 family protein
MRYVTLDFGFWILDSTWLDFSRQFKIQNLKSKISMRPRSTQTLGETLVVVWDDEHESYYPLEELRRACPCAACSGEPDLFGRMAMGAKPSYRPESFQLRGIDSIGNYAIQPNWADGHSYGIWTFEHLRAKCSCDECTANRER